MLPNSLALSSAVTFVRAFEVLDSAQRHEPFGLSENGSLLLSRDAILLAVPVLVNAAFACELLLKSMLPVGTRGHNLKTLFENPSLNQSLRNSIQNSVITIIHDNFDKEYDLDRFNQDLEQNGEDFSEWRYFHENDRTSLHASYIFMSNFLKVLNTFAIAENTTQNSNN